MRKNWVGRWVLCVAMAAPSFAVAAPPADEPEGLDAFLAPNPGGGLTSDEVASRARDTSYDAAARRAAVSAAEAKLDQALVAYYPKLTLTARYTRLSPITQPDISTLLGGGSTSSRVPPGGGATLGQTPAAGAGTFPVFLDQYVLQAGLTIPISDYVLRLSQTYAAASRSQKAAQLDEQAARLKAAADARSVYYSWVRARAQVVISERSLTQAKGHYQDARHGFDVGTASKADVLRVESQVATAELVLERTKNLVALAEQQMRIAMHDTSGLPYAVGEDLRQAPPRVPGGDDANGLRAEAISRRLEVRALDETAWSLREQAKSVRAGYYPRLEVFGDVLYANPNTRFFPPDGKFRMTWDAGVQLVWTPNEALATRGGVGETLSRVQQTEMQKAVLRDSLMIEVTQADQALREAEIAVGTTTRGLAAAEEGYRVRRELFRNGRATSVELTDSELELFRASLESVNARVDVRSARARLVHAVGLDAPPLSAAR